MNVWFAEHPWISLLLIYVFLVYVYNKVFRVRKLPLLKDLIVYALVGVGALLLLLFQLFGLPIVMCLLVAIVLMLIVRVRYWITGRAEKKS